MSRSLAVKAAVVGTLAFAALAAPTSAEAQSRLNFTGAADLYDAPGSGGTNLFIDFIENGTEEHTPIGTITATRTISGAFASSINVGTTGTITDLTVSPSDVVGLPVSPFVEIGGYTFTLNSTAEAGAGLTFGPITLVGTSAGTTAYFGVFGTVTGGEFGSTSRNFQGVLTAQFANQTPQQVFNQVNSGGTLPVAFSAEFVVGEAAVVPEPSTYLLLGTGLGALGLVGLRRRRSEG
ncbi:MAG TPA: PEP-CTERM sorting domain-containing protein [Streptomyces sp.]|nr:PEP-CTERM sorting domain-containing protein [Streptomyces sp.]